MKADAIFAVTGALRDRLKAALTASGVPGTVYVGPLDDAQASGAALILFLYRLVPSATLRNREHRLPAANPQQVDVFQNSLPLDLYFLVTLGTTPTSGEETLLSALGYAMQNLQADPDLSGPSLKQETVHISLEPLTTEEASRIWALFPTANYRTSIAYVASPVWIDPVQPAPIPAPVTTDSVSAGHLPQGQRQ